MSRWYLLFLALFCSSVAATTAIPSFQADYKIYYGGMHLGEGRYTLKKNALSDAYQFNFSSQLSFLIFSDKRQVQSTFTLHNNQLQPIRYSHERTGSGPNYLDTIKFDNYSGRISSTHKNTTIELNYDKLIRDGLTVQLQLMLDLQRGAKKTSYPILDDNKLKVRKFVNLGMETLTIDSKTYRCIKIEVSRRNSKRKTQMWFSPAHNYQPIQMTHFVKNKKQFNAHLVNYTILNAASSKPPAKLALDIANDKKKISPQGAL